MSKLESSDSSETEQLIDEDDEQNYEETLLQKLSSTRYQLSVMGFLGFALIYSFRINMSIALVDMVKQPAAEKSGPVNKNCPVWNKDTSSENNDVGTFDWTPKEQANVLGAFYYGYMVAMIPAGYLATRIGGKQMYGLGIVVTAVLTLLTPAAAHLGIWWLILLRGLEGITEAATFPAFHHLSGRWTPKLERSIFASTTLSGSFFGNMITQPIIGYLCTLELWNGWPLGFYANGLVAIIWYVAWCFLVHESPDKHPRISERERNYINSQTQIDDDKTTAIPWKSILTSLPVFGIVAAHFANNFMVYGMMSFLPLYFADVLNFDIASNGILSALPWVSVFIGTLTAGQLTDLLRSRNLVTTTFARKFNQVISTFLPSIFLLLAGYAGCDDIKAILFLAVGMLFFGAAGSGFYCNNLDLAPQFAGIIYAISNFFATLSGFLAPLIVASLTEENVHSSVLWIHAFYVFAGVSCLGGSTFFLLGSGELQAWAVIRSG